jgi:ribose transport system substrate-binding protein
MHESKGLLMSRLFRGAPAAAILTTLTLTSMGLVGCGTSDSSSTSGGGLRIGLAVSTLNNPFFVQLKQGAQDAAKAAGATLTVTDAQNDASQQANQVQNFTTQTMDAIILNPVDSDAAKAVVKAVGSTPVVAVDRGVTGADVSAFVASDNVQGGRDAATELAKQLGEKGKIVILQGIAGTSASRDRGQGFEAGIATYPNISVVAKQPADFDRTKGLDVMTNLLQAHPDITGVFAENDEMALGAIKALGSKAGTGVKVVGFDGSPDGLAAVKDGTMSATVAQLAKDLGRSAVEAAVKAAKKQTVEKTIKVPTKVVTKDNVAEMS